MKSFPEGYVRCTAHVQDLCELYGLPYFISGRVYAVPIWIHWVLVECWDGTVPQRELVPVALKVQQDMDLLRVAVTEAGLSGRYDKAVCDEAILEAY